MSCRFWSCLLGTLLAVCCYPRYLMHGCKPVLKTLANVPKMLRVGSRVHVITRFCQACKITWWTWEHVKAYYQQYTFQNGIWEGLQEALWMLYHNKDKLYHHRCLMGMTWTPWLVEEKKARICCQGTPWTGTDIFAMIASLK